MIKEWVARAMQISCIVNGGVICASVNGKMVNLTPEEVLLKLHKRERILNFNIPNWNIQEILHIQSIKELHEIPKDDLEAQEKHQERVEKDLIAAGIKFNRYTKDNMDYMDDMHSLDWMVFKNHGKINWHYSGSKGKRGGIMQRLEKSGEFKKRYGSKEVEDSDSIEY